MAITVQEAEVQFSATGLPKVQSAAAMAGKALDKLSRGAGLAAVGLAKVGVVGVRSLKGVTSAAGRALFSIGKIGAKTAAISLPGIQLAAAGMIKLAADAETLNTQFKVLIGSQEGATKLMGEIDKFAASTPFQKMEIADAARQLLAFGGSADTAVDELKMLGDISAATGQPLGELAELYGKARVQGRLYGEDINQLTGRGIPVIQALAKEFGVAESEVKGLVEKGKIGFPELQRALAGMTGPGGQFAGMMEELSGTTAGKFSTLVDNVKLLGQQMGEQLLPYANQFIDSAMAMTAEVGGFASGFKAALDAGLTWYNALSGWLQDVGVVAGVVIADFDTLWAGLFEDMQSYAAAAFDWITENAATMIKNIATAAKNAPTILENMSQNIGKELALQLIPGLTLATDKLNYDRLAGIDLAPTTEFNAPERSEKTQTVLDDIARELELSRTQRTQATGPDIADPEARESRSTANQDFVSKEKTASVAAEKEKAKDLQRGNAMSVFNRIQESLAGRTLKVQENQLKTQEKIAESSQQTVAALQSFSGGFVPVLG